MMKKNISALKDPDLRDNNMQEELAPGISTVDDSFLTSVSGGFLETTHHVSCCDGDHMCSQ